MFFRGNAEATIKNEMKHLSNTRKKLEKEFKIPEGIISQINNLTRRPLSNKLLLGSGKSYITMQGKKEANRTEIIISISTEFLPGREIEGDYIKGENQFAVDIIHPNYREEFKTKKVKVWYSGIRIQYLKEQDQVIFNPAEIHTQLQFEGENTTFTNSVALADRVNKINQKVVARILSMITIQY